MCKHLTNLALWIQKIAKDPCSGGASLLASRHSLLPHTMKTERTLFHDPFGPWPITEVMGFGVDLLNGNLRFIPIKFARPIRTCRLAITTSDAPIVVNDHDAIGFLPGGFYRTSLYARRVVALLALDGKIRVIGFGYFSLVLMVAMFQVVGSMGQLNYTNVLNLGVTTLVIFGHTSLDACPVSLAL